ncbi:MAG: SemiSWEET transporter [Burkholderiaceae bacterium]
MSALSRKAIMRSMNTNELLGYCAAFCTTISFVPQALQIIRSRNTRAISLPMYATFTVGIALWLTYGVLIQSWPVVIANAITLLLSGFILAMKLRFK